VDGGVSSIKLADTRDRALCDAHAKVFEEEDDPSRRSFFSEIISSIADVKFSLVPTKSLESGTSNGMGHKSTGWGIGHSQFPSDRAKPIPQIPEWKFLARRGDFSRVLPGCRCT
jgi:hypothetical protein